MNAITFIFGVTMISLAASEANFGYPSYIYNQPQYYAPSYANYRVPNYQYFAQGPTYQVAQQELGVQYGPIHYKPVVTSVRNVYYEPEAPLAQPLPAKSVSVSVPETNEVVPESASTAHRVVHPLRAIFPDFSRGSLRSKTDIGFLRPDEVKPIPQKFLSPNIISF